MAENLSEASTETLNLAQTQVATGTTQPVEEPAHSEQGAVLGFNGTMVLLTWTAFLIAALVLGKVLWRPILRFVEAREGEIKASLDDAAKARKAAEEADAKAAETLADAARKARQEADAAAAATQRHIATLEAEAQEAIAAKRKAAEARLEEERTEALQRLGEQTGAEIAYALERLLPGLLTDEQRQAYQDRIAADVNLKA